MLRPITYKGELVAPNCKVWRQPLALVDQLDLAKIALSCHLSLDLLCDQEGVRDSA